MSLKGKRALVTGSTSGIGFGIAKELAKAGACVVVHGLGEPGDIAAAVDEIRGAGAPDVRWVPGDLSTPQGVQEMMDAAGEIDVLVSEHTSLVKSLVLRPVHDPLLSLTRYPTWRPRCCMHVTVCR